jgi:hypothetical protein
MPQTSATTHIITCPRRIHFRDHSHKSRGECKFPNSPSSEFASATSLLRTVVDFTQRHSPSLSLARRDEIVKAHFIQYSATSSLAPAPSPSATTSASFSHV